MTEKIKVGQVVEFPEVKIEFGMFTVTGMTVKVKEILSEFYNERDGQSLYADVEFIDTCGGYHHYKSAYDGPYIIKTIS